LAVWQLGNCYFLLVMISSFVYRAIFKAVPNDPVAQERLFGAMLLALMIGDVSHVGLSLLGMPREILFKPSEWNSMTHGNTTVTAALFVVRMAWFAGVGRPRYTAGPAVKAKAT
ncbi:hypothetical protein FRB99_004039, partial [Tulasnella sp. 403]